MRGWEMIHLSSSSKLTEASYSPKNVWELWWVASKGSLTFLIAWIKTIVKRKFPRKKVLMRKNILHSTKTYFVHFTHFLTWHLASHLALSAHIYRWTCFPGKTSPAWRTPGRSWVWAPQSRPSRGRSRSTMRQVGQVVFPRSSVHTEFITAKVRDPYLAHR